VERGGREDTSSEGGQTCRDGTGYVSGDRTCDRDGVRRGEVTGYPATRAVGGLG